MEVLVPWRLVWNEKSEGSRLRHLHAKKPLVEGSGKECIQQVLMDESQAKDTTTEAKPRHNTENTGEHRHQHQNWVPSNDFSDQAFVVAALSTRWRGLRFQMLTITA